MQVRRLTELIRVFVITYRKNSSKLCSRNISLIKLKDCAKNSSGELSRVANTIRLEISVYESGL